MTRTAREIQQAILAARMQMFSSTIYGPFVVCFSADFYETFRDAYSKLVPEGLTLWERILKVDSISDVCEDETLPPDTIELRYEKDGMKTVVACQWPENCENKNG